MQKNPASQSGLYNPRLLLAFALCSVGVLPAMLSFAAAPPSVGPYQRPGSNERISRTYDGSMADGASTHPKLSGDGRMVVFASTASKILAGDNNDQEDVFVHDRVTGQTRFAAPIAEGRTERWRTIEGTLSRDGRYVVFASLGRIFPGDHIGGIYVTDIISGVTELVSVRDDGTPSQNGQHLLNNVMTAISADNRYVVFMSTANDLVPGFTPTITGYHIYIRDRVAGRTELVSLDSNSAPANLQGQSPAISHDGRFIAWETRARLVPQDTSDAMKIYLRDRIAETTELISVATDGTLPNDNVWRPRISAGGSLVVFESTAFNLVPRDVASCCQSDIFVRNRLLGTTERVSVTSVGEQINGSAARAAISDDGRYVAFWTDSTNTVTGVKVNIPDVYVRDLVTGRTELVSVAADGGFGDNGSQVPAISADGETVAWFGWATNLTADHDGSPYQHVHVRERGPTLGAYDVVLNMNDQTIAVSGSAAFAGGVVSEAEAPATEPGPGADELGPELTGALLSWRPEEGDVLVRWRVATIPEVDVQTYGLRLSADAHRYEVRAAGFGGRSVPANGDFALYDCDPVCVRVADLRGSYATVGAEIQTAIPVQLLNWPGSLNTLEAYSAQVQDDGGTLTARQTISLPDAALPTPEVRVGIAPVGTDPGESMTVPLTAGRFSGAIDTDGLLPGPYEVVITSCLGTCAVQRYPVTVGPLTPLSAVSRKSHGSRGSFDINLPFTGPPGVECRTGGSDGNYTVIFAFPNTLVSVGGASVASGNGTISSSAIDSSDGHQYIVGLTGVTNAQVITITLADLRDSIGSNNDAFSVSMGLLVGDATANQTVSNTDVAEVKAQIAVPVTSSNFRNDVNANGIISNTDVSDAKAQVSTSLP